MNQFKKKVQSKFGKNKMITVDHINHRDGSAICLLTFTNKKGVEKTISKKVFLNPETYPDALKLEGKTETL